MVIACQVCGHEDFFLSDHLLEEHGMSAAQYQAEYGRAAEVVSDELMTRFRKERGNPRRKMPPTPEMLRLQLGGIPFPINVDVRPKDCLPCPAHYRVPRHGKLSRDIQHAAVALRKGRSLYIWGPPGSGKDAVIHAYSAQTRTPAIMVQVRPGVDLQPWFFTHEFDDVSTRWDLGDLLLGLRDGYKTLSGRVIPYLVLISDFDRADESQAEFIRLIADSIKGRVMGPKGKTYDVLPGTQIVATANTAGGGDETGRMVSANPIDSSIMDRFQRPLEFHWMSWKDEKHIIAAKFPLFAERAPHLMETVGTVTEAIRKDIAQDDLYMEFSHRSVCSWVGHAQDLLEFQSGNQRPTKKLLMSAARAFLDGIGDKANRLACKRVMDPHITGGAVNEGDTNHIDTDDLFGLT